MFKRIKKAFAIIFCFLGVILSAATLSPFVLKLYYDYTFKPINENTEDLFEKRLLEGGAKMISEKVLFESLVYCNSPLKVLWKVFNSHKKTSVYGYGEYGLMLHYMYKYAELRKNAQLKKTIVDAVNNEILRGDTIFDIERTDQLAYGVILLDMYCENGDVKYRKAAEKLIRYVKSRVSSCGLLAYKDNGLQQVDVIGFSGLFLDKYFQISNDTEVLQIKKHLFREYWEHGINHTTGLPAKAYQLENKIATKDADWGRGLSWLIIGEFYSPSVENTHKVDSLLISHNPLFTQYFGGTDTIPDMSVTIPAWYYLTATHLKHYSKNDFIKELSPYISKDGLICFNSPSYGTPNSVPNSHQYNHLVQGLALYLYATLK